MSKEPLETMPNSNPSGQILSSFGKSNPMWIPHAKIRNSNKITADRNRKSDSIILSKMGSICSRLQMLPIFLFHQSCKSTPMAV